MFATDQSIIGRYGRESADNMAHVLKFVLATIQQPLFTVPKALESIVKYGDESPFIWGFKTACLADIVERKDAIYSDAMNIWYGVADPAHAERDLLIHFTSVHGLGLAKAGFAVQLLFGLSGCIDSHNVTRFGFNATDIKSSRYKSAKGDRKRQFIDAYGELVSIAGGTETLWNEWCAYVRSKHPIHYRSTDYVSELHVISLKLKRNNTC